MSKKKFLEELRTKTAELRDLGLYKEERIITSPQRAEITLSKDKQVINLCASNYLGLADHPELIKTAKDAAERYGVGMASARFICGTQDIHKQLEARISHFLGMEESILYSSCFDANTGLFETLLSEEDAIISDSLNHASIIDGIRLCKAKRYRYANNNMEDLEKNLKEAKDARFKMIATDGVFSMDGIIANLKGICDLADKYDALVMVDDCHATGFLGDQGRGSHEYCNVLKRVDILTGTLGKALGGTAGGYISSRKEIVEWLRQRSRPYLFSNTLSPIMTAVSLKVFDLLESNSDLREKVKENSRYFRAQMANLGFNLIIGNHPIIPVMLGDAKLAAEMSKQLLDHGVYVTGFSFPVVPKDRARIRTQMSAAFDKVHLDQAVEAFARVGKKLKVIS